MFMYVRMRAGVYLHEDGSVNNDDKAQHWASNDSDIEWALFFWFFFVSTLITEILKN